MNKKEMKKVNIIKSLLAGEITVKSAATRLELSERQVKRLKARAKKEGVQSMLHGNCGRQPKKTIACETKEKILEVRALPAYSTVNVKHFKELLEEKHEISVSYTFLYKFLRSNGIKSPKEKRKPTTHKRRKRKEHFGELLQSDATPHNFFGDDEKKATLHGFIDDATGTVTGLYMCENECMHGYFEVTKQTISNFGVPEALYADGSSIFFGTGKEEITIEDELNGIMQKPTQYGVIMQELGTTLIHAHSPQAKGRIERLWQTLQDRLVTEFKVYGIKTIDEANEFLKTYVSKYNKQFAVQALSKQSFFVPLAKGFDLETLFTVKYDRTLDSACCFSLNSVIFQVNGDIKPKAKVKVLINKEIGVKVQFNEKLYTVTPFLDKNKVEINSSDSIDMIINRFVYFYCFKSERIA